MDRFETLRTFTDVNKRGLWSADCRGPGNNGTKGSELVDLDIGGTRVTVSRACMRSIPGSLLAMLDTTSKHYHSCRNLYYFDRDAEYFDYILNAHREGELHVPRDACPIRFKREMEYWRIPLGLLSPCCWKAFFATDSDLHTLEAIIASRGTFPHSTDQPADTDQQPMVYTPNIPHMKHRISDASARINVRECCNRIWFLLEEPTSSRAARVWCFLYSFVVVISAVSSLAWLYPGVRVQPYLPSILEDGPMYHFVFNGTRYEFDLLEEASKVFGEKAIRIFVTDPHKALLAVDCSCMLLFVLESFIHFSVCPRKSHYFLYPYNLLRIFLCVSMTISFVLEMRKDLIDNVETANCQLVFKSMNALRLLLLFRLRKLYTGLQTICFAVEKSVKELVLLLFGIVTAVIIFGGLMFCVEVETEMFHQMHQSIWWALITMTTVGYGDFYPTTPLGYVVGFACALNGLIIVALPIAAIASNFAAFYNRSGDLQAHEKAVDKEKRSRYDNGSIPK